VARAFGPATDEGAPASPDAPRPGPGAWLRRSGAVWGLPIVIALIVVGGGLTTSGFLTADNARAVLINASIVGIAAVGMTPVTLSGNFISLGMQQTAMLGAVMLLALLGLGWGVPLAVLAVLAVLLLAGALQGLVVAAGLNPVITTLAAGAVIYGLVTLVTGGKVVTAPDADISFLGGSFLGLPAPVYCFVLYTVFTALIVDRTVIGRKMLLLGANRETARLSGISVRATTVAAFLSLALGAALAGMLTGGQLGQATSNDLQSLTVDVVAAVLVGGTAIQGGEGSPLRSALGAIIIASFNNLMLLHGFPTGVRLALSGALVAVVVSLLQILRTRGVR
jgi:ribose/xylose/arabinose/galactoside ABC-type transport system permease subunit